VFGAVFRVTFLLSLALLLPRFLLLYAPQQQVFFGHLLGGGENGVQLGVASFNDFLRQSKLDLVGQKILLVTNQLHDQTENHYLQMLAQFGVKPAVIYRSHNSMINTKINLEKFSIDLPKLTVPVLGHITGSELKKVDLILIDLQSSGLAVDDALNDLIDLMQLAKLNRKQIILLDRPNPLGCLQEGPLVHVLDRKLKFKLPLRYGLTLGEVAGYANHELFHNKIKLTVLPLKYYSRNNFNDFEQLQKVYTDGLFEMLRNTCPAEIKTDCHNNFQCLALPEYLNFSIDKWYELRAALWHYNVEVVLCRYFDRKTEQYFVGVRLLIDDINRVSYLKIWQLFFKFMHDANIQLRPSIALERVFGIEQSLELINGNLSVNSTNLWMQDLKAFYQAVKPHLIYRPWPIKVLL